MTLRDKTTEQMMQKNQTRTAKKLTGIKKTGKNKQSENRETNKENNYDEKGDLRHEEFTDFSFYVIFTLI